MKILIIEEEWTILQCWDTTGQERHDILSPVETDKAFKKRHVVDHEPMGTLSLTKEARIYKGEKTVSSISGAGKTGQLCVKDWN